MKLSSVVFLLTIFISTVASEKITKCNDEASAFVVGKSYYYNYEATVRNDKDASLNTKISCLLKVDAIGQCRFILHTSNCSITEDSDVTIGRSNLFSRQMEKHPILFTIIDGVIDSVSARSVEDLTILNLKRAIIGTFQNIQKDPLETIPSGFTERNDVQGSCFVQFKKEGKWTIISSRNLSNCTFVSDNEFSKKPISLYWGLNLNQLYSSNEECLYMYSPINSSITSIECYESPELITTSVVMSFQPRLKRILRYVETKPTGRINIDFDKDYRTTNIHYEYQNRTINNPINLKIRVVQLMEEILDLPSHMVDLRSIWLFNDLVDLLKESITLSTLSKGVGDCWGSPKCQSSRHQSAESNRIQIGHIWRDALFKCNSVACANALKVFIISNPISPEIVSDRILTTIFFRWLLSGNNDPDFIFNIYEICSHTNQSTCYLALSANIHKYWKSAQKKNLISPKMITIVENIMAPLKFCKNATIENSDVHLALKMLSNIGEFAEIVEPNLVDTLNECAVSPMAEWEINLAAVQAFRRLDKTNKLFQYLREIINGSRFTLNLRVNCYLIVVEKWGEEGADFVESILKSEETPLPFKHFIYSHINSVLRTPTPKRHRLAKAFQIIIDESPEEFLSLNMNNKKVSSYNEYFAYHQTPFLSSGERFFGFLLTEIELYDGSSLFPSSLSYNLKLTLFGNEIEVGEISVNSKGFVKILSSVVKQVVVGGERDSKAVTNLLFNPQIQTAIKKFALLFNIDEDISTHLEKIFNKVLQSSYVKPSLILGMKALGEEAGFATFLTFLATTLSKTGIKAGEDIFRTYMNLMSSTAEVPTSLGLPLKFVTDSEIPISFTQQTHHKLEQSTKGIVGMTKSVSFSFAALFRTQSKIELHGFYDLAYSDEVYAATSGAFDIDVSLDLNTFGEKSIRFDFPANSIQAFSISKQHVVIKNGKRLEMFVNEKQKPASCSNLHFGGTICRRNMFEHGTTFPNFFSSLTMSIPESHPVAVQLALSSNFDAENSLTNNYASLSYLHGRSNKFHELFKGCFSKYLKKDLMEVQVKSEMFPNLNLEVKLSNITQNDYQIHLKGSHSPEFNLDYKLVKMTSKSGNDLSNFATDHLTKAKVNKLGLLGDHYEHKLSLSTSTGTLNLHYVKQKFPLNHFYDLSVQYSFIDEAKTQTCKNILSSPVFWKDNNLSLEAHYESEWFLNNFYTKVPEFKSYGLLRFPSYVLDVAAESSVKKDFARNYDLHITSHRLPSKEIEMNYTLNIFQKDSFENGYGKSECAVKIMVPLLTWVFSMERKSNADYEGFIAKFQRGSKLEQFQHNNDNAENVNDEFDGELVFDINLSRKDDIDGELDSDIIINQNENDELDGELVSDTKLYIISSPFFTNGGITVNYGYKGFPGYDDEGNFNPKSNGNANFNCTWTKFGSDINYKLSSTGMNRSIVGSFLKTDYFVFEEKIIDKANTLISLFTAKGSFNNFPNDFHFVENFTSDVYTYFSKVNWEKDNNGNSKVDLSITGRSPIWTLLNVDLKQVVADRSETMNMTHELMDISVEASWVDGYKKSFAFTSHTDLIPSMRWKLDCSSVNYCLAQLVFSGAEYSNMFIVYQLSPGGTEMCISVCWNEVCDDITMSSNNFIAKVAFSLVDKFEIVKTVALNKAALEEIQTKVLNKLGRVAFMMGTAIGNPLHPVHTIYHHFVGLSVEESFERIQAIAFNSVFFIAGDVTYFFNPLWPALSSTREIAKSLLMKVTGPNIEKITGIDSTYMYSPRRVQRSLMWLYMIPDFFKTNGIRPGPYPGISWVEDLSSPLALTNLTQIQMPLLIKPELLQNIHLSLGSKHQYYDTFYDEAYSRIGLVIGTIAVKPFSGGLIPITRPNCPYLLALDLEEHDFVVYSKNSWLHFILNDTHVELSYETGDLVVDSSSQEYPYQDKKQEFSLTRMEDLIILESKLHLKVICDLKGHYCVIYTTIWKFGKLYGLLGNNTDDSDFKSKNPGHFTSQFELSASCDQDTVTLSKEKETPSMACSQFHSYLPLANSLAMCSDAIDSQDFSSLCFSKQAKQMYKETETIVKSYYAACGASGVKLDQPWLDAHIYGGGCNNYGRHSLSKKLQVAFLIDQSLDHVSLSNYSIGLTNLVLRIKRTFMKENYSEIKFTLFGLNGINILNKPTLYTTKNKLWANAEDFALGSLSTLVSMQSFAKNMKQHINVFEAIRLVMKTTPFDVEAIPMLVLINPNDPYNDIEIEEMFETWDSLSLRPVTFHVVSNFKDIPKESYRNHHQTVFDTKKVHPAITDVQGHLTRLSAATGGYIWSLPHLINKNQEFLSDFSKELLLKSEELSKKCVSCTCQRPFHNPTEKCQLTTCYSK